MLSIWKKLLTDLYRSGVYGKVSSILCGMLDRVSVAVIIKLTGPNYKEFHRRKGSSITRRPLKCIERHRSYNRIGFGVRTLANNDIEIVALTCRTKQELSGGAKTGTNAWEKHLSTTGRARWFDYKKGFITSWRIY